MKFVLGACCVIAFGFLIDIALCWAAGRASRAEEAEERKREAKEIEDTLNPIIDELGEEMGHQLPHIKIEWED